VHTFKASTSRRRLRINEEHDAYRWAKPAKVRRFSNRVTWLEAVLGATLHRVREDPAYLGGSSMTRTGDPAAHASMSSTASR
jgi:hypothetical protein